MAVTAKMYSNFPHKALEALISDLSAASKVKCMLLTDSYTPDQEADTELADVVWSTNEVEGDGYDAFGAVLTTPTVTEATRVTKFDADDVEWAESTITARYAVLYDAVASGHPLILWVDFGEDKSSENGTFKIEWNASGIFTVTVAA